MFGYSCYNILHADAAVSPVWNCRFDRSIIQLLLCAVYSCMALAAAHSPFNALAAVICSSGCTRFL